MIGIDPAEINTTIDSNPGSSFDLVRIAEDVDEDTARLIAESTSQLPGVEIAVEARREYPDGAADVADPRLHRTRVTGAAPGPPSQGLPAGRPARQDRRRVLVRDATCAASTARSASSGTPVARRPRCSRPRPSPSPATRSRSRSIRKIQKEAEKALKWGIKEIGIKRGVFIVMNPQTGEVLAMVSLPTYDNNLFARGISTKDFKKLVKNKDQPLLNHAVQAHYPPGSTYKLVAGTGGLADKKITATTRIQTKGVSDRRREQVLRLEPPRLRALRHLLRFRALERHVLLHGRRHARDRPARLLGAPVRVRASDRHRPPG